MPAGIEVSGDLAAFVGSRQEAWHKLGTVVQEDLTVAEGLYIGHLSNWNVRKVPLLVPTMDGGTQEVGLHNDFKYATVRDDPFHPGQINSLGVGLSDTYRIFQNEENAQFAQDMIDLSEGRVVLDAGGSLHGGSRVFITLRPAEDVTVAGTDDTIRPYLIGTWTHAGDACAEFYTSYIRVVCKNTLDMSMWDKSARRFKVRHVGNGLEGRLAEAREALAISITGTEHLSKIAAQWAARDVEAKEFDAIVAGLFPLADDAASRTKTVVEGNRADYRTLYTDAPTQENVRGTAWAALNAYTEWSDWFAGSYKTDNDRARAQIESGALAGRRNKAVEVISGALELAAV